jgi:hypothetical protein
MSVCAWLVNDVQLMNIRSVGIMGTRQKDP